jgi:thiol-disulfide isomerase/thioredoxin
MRAVLVLALVASATLGLVACSRSSAITQDAPTTPSGAKPVSSAAGTGAQSAEPAVEARTADASREPAVRVVVAGQDSDALSVVRTERLRAKAEGRVLVVYAGAGWCEPCKRFKHAIQTGALDDKLSKTTLLVFDADRDTERLASAGYRFQFIPYVGLPGADGHPTDSAEARAKGSESWRELIAKLETWQSKGP